MFLHFSPFGDFDIYIVCHNNDSSVEHDSFNCIRWEETKEDKKKVGKEL